MSEFDKITLIQLKTILEERTGYGYEINNRFNRERIILLGLPKETKIEIYLGHYYKTEKRFISVSLEKDTYGYSSPCDSFDEMIEEINDLLKKIKFIPKKQVKQLSIFED